MSADVKALFPGRERTQRVRRGRAPRKFIVPPTFDEMVGAAHKILFTEKLEENRTIAFFYLLQRENFYGYLKLVEDKDYPLANSYNNYRELQYLYDDICVSPDWHSSLDELIGIHTNKPTARINNGDFMKRLREKFIPKPEEPAQNPSNGLPARELGV